ncbi:flagellar basal body rod protein FlgB [Mesobacillus zeae]|uniref:Flagellar basal body rod protein FlgB n=1 Tax=Mesobacillus zeae TaxID=1917180 RepID=A0A398BH71_9BACI|nr:flagellar basal body rod protein FlgB [Mesobacillus zeae]RID87988.1 flagellar basal body rod protein FlgB [Mesobacillus zeae]
MKLFSNTFSSLEKAMDYSTLKQKVISQNIANVDTPQYKKKDVSFKSVLDEAMGTRLEANKTSIRHLDFKENGESGYGTVIRQNVNYNHNGNGVDLDKEMSDLATNQIYYNALTERLSGKFNSLQTVIRGGK